MDNLFLLIALSSFFGCIYGLIKPKKAIFWTTQNKERPKAFGVYFTLMLISFILFGITIDRSKSNKIEAQYKIDSKDKTSNQITLNIIIPEHYGKDTLIEITRQLKEEYDWREKFVCFFEVGASSNSAAWASCAYLPNCFNCATDTDNCNNPVKFSQIGLTREKVTPLINLQFDSIPNKVFVAAYIDDIFGYKNMFFKISHDQALEVQLKPHGKLINHLTIIKDGTHEKYYYNELTSWFDKKRDGHVYWTFDNKKRLAAQHGEGNHITYKYCLPNP